MSHPACCPAFIKQLHPDLHPSDAGKQAQFQAVSAAHDLLSDIETRRRFDAGGIDAQGHERPERQFYRHYAEQDGGRCYDPHPGAGGYESASDLFSDLFERRQGGGPQYRQEFHARGPDLRYTLEIDFLDAATGVKKSVTMPDGNRIEISFPPGTRGDQTFRLRGKGGAGFGNGPAGDALVTVIVRSHPVFTLDGDNIEVEVPITFDEAVLGAKIEVPTISGPVSMTVPKGVSSGHRLRLKGKGIATGRGAAGDQYVRLRIALPDRVDTKTQDLAMQWRAHAPFDPRGSCRASMAQASRSCGSGSAQAGSGLRMVKTDMKLAKDTIAIILPLLDQLHQTRRELRALTEVLAQEPVAVRHLVTARVWKKIGAAEDKDTHRR